ncbi:MAG: hypothetical protein QM760_05330 [Nibricoccus sp.]
MNSVRRIRRLLYAAIAFSTVASVTLLHASFSARRSARALITKRSLLQEQLQIKHLQAIHAASLPPSHDPASATDGAATVNKPPATQRSAQDVLADEPTLQTQQLKSRRALFAVRYAPFLLRQSLSTAQTSALEGLYARREEQRLDLAAVMRSHRLSSNDPSIQQLRAQTDLEFQNGLRQLVGDIPAGTFIEFERKLPAWSSLSNFAGTSALEGQPLTGDQATELANIIASASPSFQAGNEVAPDDVDWPAVITQTPAVLTPPQSLSFRNMLPRYPIEAPSPQSAP